MRIYSILVLFLSIISIVFSRSIPLSSNDDDSDELEQGSDQRDLNELLLLARLRNLLEDEEESAESIRKKRQIDDDDDDDIDEDADNNGVQPMGRDRLEDLRKAFQNDDDDETVESNQIIERNGPGQVLDENSTLRRVFQEPTQDDDQPDDDDDDAPATTTKVSEAIFDDDDD